MNLFSTKVKQIKIFPTAGYSTTEDQINDWLNTNTDKKILEIIPVAISGSVYPSVIIVYEKCDSYLTDSSDFYCGL